jgi:hypothetical protein
VVGILAVGNAKIKMNKVMVRIGFVATAISLLLSAYFSIRDKFISDLLLGGTSLWLIVMLIYKMSIESEDK